MAKKKEIEIQHKPFLAMNLEDVMGDRFGRYSKYIIQERALPDARDGLKPVQRRILYAMHHDGNTSDKPYRKSAKTVGLVIGNYHPHGDSSVYDAMVRLSQDWKVRYPLIDMHGNNGSIDDDPAAAMRYTEARLAKVTRSILEDIQKETVEMAPNFDDTEMEPTVLPSCFPTLLVNGATGIAAGYATNIPPSNLKEVIEAVIMRMQNPQCTVEDIMEVYPGPDFPTGAIVQGKEGIIDAFKTGKGRVVIRSKSEIVETKTCQQIIITEIPYEVIKMNLVKKMDEIRLNKDIEGILDVRDESDRNGLRIVVDIKKDADANNILNYFYKNTDLQIYYNYNMVSIVDQRPMLLGVVDMLDAFIHHRQQVVLRRCKYDLAKMDSRCHILEGLMKAVSILDEIIDLIRKSKDKADSKRNLMEAFNFTEKQAEAIVTLQLYRLSSTDIVALREEFAMLISKMEELKTIIGNRNVLRSVIIKELRQVQEEYGDERRSQIEDEVTNIVIDKMQMISNDRVMVTVSRDGYVKRVSLRSYQASEGVLTGVKEGDRLIGALEVDTLDTLLCFTSQGNYAYLPVYQIDEAKWKDVGMHMNKVVKMQAEDKIVSVIAVKNFDSYAWILTLSQSGYIKKTPISEWKVQRNNKVMTAMKLKDSHDRLLKAMICYPNQEIVLLSKDGYLTRYSIDQVPSNATKSQGVIAMKFGTDDGLASGCVIVEDKEALCILSESGQMKRIRFSEFVGGNRPYRGERICKKLKSNPYQIAEAFAVSPYDDLLLLDPEVHQLQAKEISLMAKDATFSTPLSLQKDWYRVVQIEEVKLYERSAVTEVQQEEVHDDIEMLSLFDEE